MTFPSMRDSRVGKVWISDAGAAKELADALIDCGWVDEMSATREDLPKWLMGQDDEEEMRAIF